MHSAQHPGGSTARSTAPQHTPYKSHQSLGVPKKPEAWSKECHTVGHAKDATSVGSCCSHTDKVPNPGGMLNVPVRCLPNAGCMLPNPVKHAALASTVAHADHSHTRALAHTCEEWRQPL